MNPSIALALAAGAWLLLGSPVAWSQTSAGKITPVPPSAAPAAPSTGATATGLPSPSGLRSQFPAGLTAGSAPAVAGNAITTPTPTTPPTTSSGGRAVVAQPNLGGVDAAVATNVMGAAPAGGVAQPPEVGPGPYTAVEVARSFILADANRDGELSRAEARRLLLGGLSFEELDRDHDGIITRFEYEDALGR